WTERMSLDLSNPLLRAVDAEAEALTELLRRRLVAVRTDRTGSGGRTIGGGRGPGLVWRPGGLVVANHHVIAGAATPRVELPDGRELPARVLATDPTNDVALLHVADHDLPETPIADARATRVGSLVLAVGNPWGVTGVVTAGVFSGLLGGR